MRTSKELMQSLSREALVPQEEMLEVVKKKGSLFIGIPKEISYQENRIALVPDDVALLVNNGHQVLVETNAGKNAHFEATLTPVSDPNMRVEWFMNGRPLTASESPTTRIYKCPQSH